MKSSIKIWIATFCAICGACGDAEVAGDDDADGVVQAASGDAFVGAWEENDAAPGYQAFMVIETGAKQGYLCNEDGKSQAAFKLMVDGDRAVMGKYGYGAGDVLTLGGNEVLTREGKDHGQVYTVSYEKSKGVPAWCQEQIDEMK